MTDSETYELIGRKREEYFNRKKERAALPAEAGELAGYANTISIGLVNPEAIRWWDGTPMIGRTTQHVTLTSAMFQQLTESNVKQICADLKRLDAVIAALRQELTSMEGRAPD